MVVLGCGLGGFYSFFFRCFEFSREICSGFLSIGRFLVRLFRSRNVKGVVGVLGLIWGYFFISFVF